MVFTECIKQRRWIVLVMSLAMTIIALSSYLAYRELCKIWREHDILLQYGNLFLTPEEIMRLKATMRPKKVPVDPYDRKSDGFCFSNCSHRTLYDVHKTFREGENVLGENLPLMSPENLLNDTGNATTAMSGTQPMAMAQSQSDVTHHACCSSRRRMITPVRVQNIYEQDRLVVQFKNRNQVFFTDECYQARGCTGCRCAQVMATYAAVVIDDDGRYGGNNQPRRRNFAGYRLELIRLPGCCKCMNNLT